MKTTTDGFQYGQRYFEYQNRFGEYARDAGRSIDHAGAIAFLREHKDFFEGMRKKYAEDKYWPPLTPPYLSLEVEPEIKGHEAKMVKAN